jgi:diaminopimelate decarboxylase
VNQPSRTAKLSLFPFSTGVDSRGHLTIGGCDVVELAATYGTPLYVFDEATLRAKCAEHLREFSESYPDCGVIYASKAFLCPAIARIFDQEGLGLDIVSAGEFRIADSAGFPPGKIYFHGNNKSADELRLALQQGIGRVVVDNFHELGLLDTLAKECGRSQDILLRLSPGVDPHTHKHVATGVLDSKFGFPISTGQAEEAVSQSAGLSGLKLIGVHFHLGSSIFETAPYLDAIEIVLEFAARMRERHNLEMQEFNIGGGFAVQYQRDAPAPPVGAYARAIASKITTVCHKLGMSQPKLVIEPGRSIVAQAGTALYTTGSTKDIPGLRKYIFVDGGMGDNIRPALYGSRYEAMVANKADSPDTNLVTLAGRFCESGDILIRDILLPPIEPGDILALPAAGAYSLPMASNYNGSLRPAVVMVKDGQAHLIRRRETYEDLTRHDVT